MNPKLHTEQMFKPGDQVKAAQYSLLEEYMLDQGLDMNTIFIVESFDLLGRIHVSVPNHFLANAMSARWLKWGRINGTLWERGNFTKVELPQKRSQKQVTHISVANTPSTAAGWVYESPQHKIQARQEETTIGAVIHEMLKVTDAFTALAVEINRLNRQRNRNLDSDELPAPMDADKAWIAYRDGIDAHNAKCELDTKGRPGATATERPQAWNPMDTCPRDAAGWTTEDVWLATRDYRPEWFASGTPLASALAQLRYGTRKHG